MNEWKELSFKKGEIIYRQHQFQRCMYILRGGCVALYQNYGEPNELLIKEVVSEGYLGEMELIEARPRTVTAVATEPTVLRVVTAEDFSACFEEKPAMIMAIMQQMSARIRELTKEYNDACRIAAESLEAENEGREKSPKLQSERKKLSDYYRACIRLFGAN